MNKDILERHFSHIYIEKEALKYAESKEILNKFKSSKIIEINNYKSIFNRPKQDWRKQKQSQKLILAVKKEGLLYDGSKFAPDFGHPNFYYNSLILNCLYDCDYCYLQGMYPSANIVMFVNNQDFIIEVKTKLEKLKSLYLCISYDTDLLSFENIYPYTAKWIEFARKHKDLTIELRTKSSNLKSIENITSIDNFILAWTISPEEIFLKYENRTASTNARLKCLEKAISLGWKTRLCIDPIIYIENWKDIYSTFIEDIFSNYNLQGLLDISIGTFRINSKYLKNIKKQRQDSDILFFPYEKENQESRYPQEIEKEIISFISNKFKDKGIPINTN